MSQENVESFKRSAEAGNRNDWDALLEELDPEVEWHPGLLRSLAGGEAVYHRREGVREWFESVEEVLRDVHVEYSEVRDLGDRIVAIGAIRSRGEVSGAETVSPLAYLIHYREGKAIRVQSYFDPEEALRDAGLSE